MNLEATRKPPNKELYLSACYNFVISITTLLAWEETRVAEDSMKSYPFDARDLTHWHAKELLEKKDLDGLLRLVSIATEVKSNFQSDLDKKFIINLSESKENADKWNVWFLWSYIIGSLLIGIRWGLTSILNWPQKLKRIDTIQADSET